MKVTPETILCEAIKLHPRVAEVLTKFNMQDCLGCRGAKQETIAHAALQHRADLKELVKALNAAVKDAK